MRLWTFTTILGKDNTRTLIFTIYRPCKENIVTVVDTTIIKQQWLVMQQIQWKEHPRDASITYIIIAINKKRNEDHNIVLAIDSNERFFDSSGGIVRICRDYKFFDPLDHKHGNACNSKSFLRGSERIDCILCSLAILTTVLRCGMTGFNEVTTTSDHCGFFLDLTRDVLLKGKTTTIPSPFERQLQSKSPKSVRKYKHYFKNQIIKNIIEKKIE